MSLANMTYRRFSFRCGLRAFSKEFASHSSNWQSSCKRMTEIQRSLQRCGVTKFCRIFKGRSTEMATRQNTTLRKVAVVQSQEWIYDGLVRGRGGGSCFSLDYISVATSCCNMSDIVVKFSCVFYYDWKCVSLNINDNYVCLFPTIGWEIRTPSSTLWA